MKIKVVKADKSSFWYSKFIGDVFEVTGSELPYGIKGLYVRHDNKDKNYYVSEGDFEYVSEEDVLRNEIGKLEEDIKYLQTTVDDKQNELDVKKSLLNDLTRIKEDDIIACAKFTTNQNGTYSEVTIVIDHTGDGYKYRFGGWGANQFHLFSDKFDTKKGMVDYLYRREFKLVKQ